MRPVLTPAQMAAVDAAAVAGGVPKSVLVERAGAAVARAARRMLRGTYGRRVVVVRAQGNNGADGAVAARWLSAWGVRVDVFALADGIGRRDLERALARADLAVDAMYGTGLRGVLGGDAALVASMLASSRRPSPGGSGPDVGGGGGRGAGMQVLAVDIPSGVDGSTGAVPGPAVVADATVCFAALKPGLVFVPGSLRAGVVEVVDIGLAIETADLGVTVLGVTELSDVTAWVPGRPVESHKWSVGGVYVVAGGAGMTGAAALTSRAALRAGAGIVVCGLPGEAAERLSGGEVITRRLSATGRGALAEAAAAEVLGGLDRFRGLVMGPGLGRAPETVEAVRRLVAGSPVPMVLDADGLNALDGDLAAVRARTAATVLTPHEGEYERLAGRAVGEDRVEAARWLAAESGAVVLLKGPQSVAAAPSGRAAVNPTGGPWLASAGTGDVLSGIVGALLARGVPAFEAAAAGAYIHGLAALHGPGNQQKGNPGLVAGDLIDALPKVLPAG